MNKRSEVPTLRTEYIFGNEFTGGTHSILPEIPLANNVGKGSVFFQTPRRDASVPQLRNLQSSTTDPLEKYMTKANAKNWSDFANRIIKKGKYNKKQNRNNKLAVLEKVVFKSNKGAELDICRLKRPLSSKRRSVDASEHVKVELRTSKCSGGPDDSMRAMPKRKKKGGSSKLSLAEAGKYAGKVNIDLEQIELLESIGVLLKFKDTYYPQSMTEVAYFVQQIFGGQLVREEDAVPQDVKDFGLAAYRNNLHLSDREECIVLIDWLKMMKEKFALSEPRNLQLLLSFCMGEAVRMSKIECNERGLLVQLVWKEALNIMKEQQETFQNAKREITHKWMDKNKEFEEALSKKFKEMKSQINDMSELIEKLQKEIRSKDFELERLMKENKELKDRCQALSGILDHLAAKSISDGKKYSKNQKRLILAKLRQLEKDREALQTYFPEKIDTPVNRLEMLKKELEKSVEEELNEEDVKEKEEVNEQIEVANEEEASVKVEEKEVTSTKNTNKKSRVKRKVHLEQKATQTNKTITVEKYVGGSDDEAEVEESEEEEYVTEITEELKPAPILPTVQMPKSVKSSLSPSNRESPKLQTRINTELPKKHAVEQNTEEEESEEELEEEDEELVKPVKSKPKLEEKPAKKVDLAPKKPLAKPKEMKKTSSELKGTSRIKKAPEEKKAPAKETITVAKPQRPSKEPSPLPPKPTPVNKEQFSTQKPIITPITVTMTGPEEPKDISEDTLPLAKPPAPALKNNTNVEPLPRPSIVQPSITPVTESSIKTVIESHIDQISPNLKTLLTQFFSDMLSFQYIEQIYQLILKCCKGIPYEVPILLNKTTVSPSISPKSLSQEPHRALTEPKSNVSRSVSPSEDRPSDTIIIDHEALKLEDPATELPKKLMAAMSHMTDKISHLETDEYGEWLLDITKDSELVERIRKNGHLLTLLLRKLYKKKENKEIGTGYNSDIRIYNNETQTETVFTAETLQKLIGSSEREYAGKIWKDQAIQTAIIPPIKSHSPMPIFSKLHDMGQTTVITKEKDVRYLTTPPSPVSSRELKVRVKANRLPVTVVQPFNLGRSYNTANIVRTHPGQWFMSAFLEGLLRRDSKCMNVAPIPVRMLLRQINTLYGERISASSAHTQPLASFIYDSYVNKYGLLNVAERKLKEMLVSVALHRSKMLKVEVFARFVGISEVRYTADDLHLLLTAAVRLLQKVSNVSYKKRESLVFEGIRMATIKEGVETVLECFHERWAEKVRGEMCKYLRVTSDVSEDALLNVDFWCQTMVEVYKKLKREMQEYLVSLGVVRMAEEYTEKYYDNAGYKKILEKVGLTETKEEEELFDKYAVFLREEDEVVKRICLENVISFLIRAGVNISKE